MESVKLVKWTIFLLYYISEYLICTCFVIFPRNVAKLSLYDSEEMELQECNDIVSGFNWTVMCCCLSVYRIFIAIQGLERAHRAPSSIMKDYWASYQDIGFSCLFYHFVDLVTGTRAHWFINLLNEHCASLLCENVHCSRCQGYSNEQEKSSP